MCVLRSRLSKNENKIKHAASHITVFPESLWGVEGRGDFRYELHGMPKVVREMSFDGGAAASDLRAACWGLSSWFRHWIWVLAVPFPPHSPPRVSPSLPHFRPAIPTCTLCALGRLASVHVSVIGWGVRATSLLKYSWRGVFFLKLSCIPNFVSLGSVFSVIFIFLYLVGSLRVSLCGLSGTKMRLFFVVHFEKNS